MKYPIRVVGPGGMPCFAGTRMEMRWSLLNFRITGLKCLWLGEEFTSSRMMLSGRYLLLAETLAIELILRLCTA